MSDQIAEAITAHWGERCNEYAEGCPCCDAWKQYDDLSPASPTDTVRQTAEWEGEWRWWAGTSEDTWMTVGPCETREQAIDEAIQDGFAEWLDKSQDPPVWKNSFHVCECRQDPLRLADWIEADWILERADEILSDSDRVSCEFDDGPWFECSKEQEADLKTALMKACDDWQMRNGLTFTSSTFSHVRNGEDVCTPTLRALAAREGE